MSTNLFLSEIKDYVADMMSPYISLDFKTSSSLFSQSFKKLTQFTHKPRIYSAFICPFMSLISSEDVKTKKMYQFNK